MRPSILQRPGWMTGCPSHSRLLPHPAKAHGQTRTNLLQPTQPSKTTNPPTLIHPPKLTATRLSRAPIHKPPAPNAILPPSPPPARCPFLSPAPRPAPRARASARLGSRGTSGPRNAQPGLEPRDSQLPRSARGVTAWRGRAGAWRRGAGAGPPPGVPNASPSPPAPASASRAPPAPAGCPGSAAAPPCCASPCWAEAGSGGASLGAVPARHRPPGGARAALRLRARLPEPGSSSALGLCLTRTVFGGPG